MGKILLSSSQQGTWQCMQIFLASELRYRGIQQTSTTVQQPPTQDSHHRTNDAAQVSRELRLRQLQIKANSHFTGVVTKINMSHTTHLWGKLHHILQKTVPMSTDDRTNGEMVTLPNRLPMLIEQLCCNHNCFQLSECRSKVMSKPKYYGFCSRES